MNQNKILSAAKKFAQQIHSQDYTGHDFMHIQRVVNMAKTLQGKEGGDYFVIVLAAWLHDVEDEKLKDSNDSSLADFFNLVGLPKDTEVQIREIISQVSFSGGFGLEPTSLEAKIVQDSDRLDALGAIGIARTIAYGTTKKRKLYDYTVPVDVPKSKEAYRSSNAPTLHHFQHKLLLLKDQMQTQSGREIAEQRHVFMLEFLEQFYSETRF